MFRGFNGEVLAVRDKPVPAEGVWPYDRTVLLSFPSAEEARRWWDSPAYREIARHRLNGTSSNVVVLDGFPASAPVGS